MTTLPTSTVITPRGRVSYAETGHGRPVVMLHSLLTDSRAFDRVIPDLAGRIVTIDLPGFGATVLTAATVESFADLMAAAIAEICAGERPVLVGNGLGSFVALGVAIRHPQLLARLVLAGCGATFPISARPAFTNMIDQVSAGGMVAVTPIALKRIYTDAYLEAHPSEADERSAVLARTDPTAFVTACRALETMDFSDLAGAVSVPTLLVVGEEDRATPPEMAEHLHGLIAGSQLVRLPGVAHAPQLQDPNGFVHAIERFLEEE